MPTQANSIRAILSTVLDELRQEVPQRGNTEGGFGHPAGAMCGPQARWPAPTEWCLSGQKDRQTMHIPSAGRIEGNDVSFGIGVRAGRS
jgi:hypothetical protein